MQTGMRLLAGIALLAPASSAQTLYQTAFDDASGWTLGPPVAGNPGWSVDALPASTPFGAFRSPPNSLNYNNDLDYNFTTASLLQLKASSPLIDLSVATGIPVLTFWCNNRSQEGECDIHEKLFLRVLAGTATKAGECVHWWEPDSTCRNALAWPDWHRHTLVLDRAWGVVQAVFETRVDSIGNDTEGWFLDDFEVRSYRAPFAYCTAKVNSQGCTPSIGWLGIPSLDPGSSFHVTAAQLLNNTVGMLLYGVSGQAAVPFMGGLLCVAGGKQRTPVQGSGGNPPPTDCSGRFSFDFLDWQASGIDPTLIEGTQVNAQYWYRDAADPFTVGLTDALEFVLLP